MPTGRAYLDTHAWLARHPRLTLAGVIAGLALATAGLLRLEIDLSFRPLFATGGDVAGPTEAFERQFGQLAGSRLFVVLENRDTAPDFFLAVSGRLLRSIDNLPGVAGVSRVERKPASADGRRLPRLPRVLIVAKLESRLEDIDARRTVVGAINDLLAELPGGIDSYLTGVSAVEVAYEQRVLEGQLKATALTSGVLAGLLLLAFGRLGSLAICLLPVTLAIPATLGLMGWLGIPVTIINTALPALILVIGVADAVHMHAAWLDSRHDRHDRHDLHDRDDARGAAERMLRQTGRACAFTTATTAAGFLSLLVADLHSVADFGLAAAIGIVVAFMLNQLLVPWLSRHDSAPLPLRTPLMAALDRHVDRLIDAGRSRPRSAVALLALLALLVGAAVPFLSIEQRFNEELPTNDPVSVAQRIGEEEFGGFLGPELDVSHRRGGSLLEEPVRAALKQFVEDVAELPGVHSVTSILDCVPECPADAAPRRDAGFTNEELVNADASRLAVVVRTGDLGTRRALQLRRQILARAALFADVDVRVVGQWWLAQYGMSRLLTDMLKSLLAASLIVLPLLWLLARRWREFLAALAANLLPVILPLGFMAAAGIRLRIGTAVVLAMALGIAVDNTMHVVDRLMSPEPGGRPRFGATGRAVALTTLALVAAFLSMLVNDMLVIREMGLVAAVTFVGAMVADLVLLPALLCLLVRTPRIVDNRLELSR